MTHQLPPLTARQIKSMPQATVITSRNLQTDTVETHMTWYGPHIWNRRLVNVGNPVEVITPETFIDTPRTICSITPGDRIQKKALEQKVEG